jgi:hypothetical protein
MRGAHALDRVEDRVRRGPIRDRLAHVAVVDAPVAPDDEDRRDRDVLPLHRDAVRERGLQIGIGEEREADALLACEPSGVLDRIDADRDEGDALRLEVLLPLGQLT